MGNITNNKAIRKKQMNNLTTEQRILLSQVFDAMRDDTEGNGAAKLATAKRLKEKLIEKLRKK